MREVKFYRTEGGKEPVKDFLEALEAKKAKKVAWVLKLVEEMDWVPKQYFKKLENTNDIWEVLIQFGKDDFRLLGFWDTGKFIILCHAFAKKSQQTPAKEINVAEIRKADHFRRKEKV